MVFVPGLAAADYTSFAEAAAETGLAVSIISSQACSAGSCCTGPTPLNCSSKVWLWVGGCGCGCVVVAVAVL